MTEKSAKENRCKKHLQRQSRIRIKICGATVKAQNSPLLFLSFFQPCGFQSSGPRTEKSFDARHSYHIKIRLFRQSSKFFTFFAKGFGCPLFLFVVYHFITKQKTLSTQTAERVKIMNSRLTRILGCKSAVLFRPKMLTKSRQAFRLMCKAQTRQWRLLGNLTRFPF